MDFNRVMVGCFGMHPTATTLYNDGIVFVGGCGYHRVRVNSKRRCLTRLPKLVMTLLSATICSALLAWEGALVHGHHSATILLSARCSRGFDRKGKQWDTALVFIIQIKSPHLEWLHTILIVHFLFRPNCLPVVYCTTSTAQPVDLVTAVI